MNIAIIGAGWYGCHLGVSLIQAGHSIKIFEKSSSSISGASKRNQNRLHLGFHYPRDHETRKQSKEGFDWFIEHYGHLTEKVQNNFYAVSNDNSYIDYETYKIIMEGTGLEFKELDCNEVNCNFKKLSKLISCGERVIKNNLASDYFNNILSKHIEFNTYVDLCNSDVVDALKTNFDYVIDCTWGTGRSIKGIDYFYEPCIYFYYRKKSGLDFALTIMDGEHYSLYPYHSDIYTLTSVKNTPLGQTRIFNEALVMLNSSKQDSELIKSKRAQFEKEYSHFQPSFLDDFEFEGVEFSMKTKVISATDFRGCIVKEDNRIISVFSGKIDTLHIAENKVFEVIG
ncbi:FAD-dependent oxidoreductase [Photobacterium sp. ZSDE20]|nr:FAD-dependent oxidoreductase [Photobacterium sp. ZSDE20]